MWRVAVTHWNTIKIFADARELWGWEHRVAGKYNKVLWKIKWLKEVVSIL